MLCSRPTRGLSHPQVEHRSSATNCFTSFPGFLDITLPHIFQEQLTRALRASFLPASRVRASKAASALEFSFSFRSYPYPWPYPRDLLTFTLPTLPHTRTLPFPARLTSLTLHLPASSYLTCAPYPRALLTLPYLTRAPYPHTCVLLTVLVHRAPYLTLPYLPFTRAPYPYPRVLLILLVHLTRAPYLTLKPRMTFYLGNS